MRILLSIALTFAAFSANAQPVKLKDYNWTLTDIASKGLNREDLFEGMDTDFVKPQSSICSNRALMWAQDFKSKQGLNTAKLFLFYTKKKSRVGSKTWWYHVTPAINENGTIWAMDPGFPSFIDEPLNILDWAETFTNSRNCKEIRASDTDLVERMFMGQVFPHSTSHGYYDCYYMLAPHTIWTPETLAMNLTGRNEDGKPVNFSRPTIDQNEYYQACIEATTGKFSFFMGNNRDTCKRLSENL